MSKFIENHPSAIEVFLFYEREKGKSVLYEKLCKVIGEKWISEEEFKKVCDKVKNMKQREIRQLVDNDQTNLRLCILSDVIDKEPMVESVLSIAKIIGTFNIDGHEFEFWFNRFFSGNWNLYQKTFSDLPIEILSTIVENLDFPSQAELRRVSHGLRNIVDQVKPSVFEISYEYCSENTLDVEISVLKGPASVERWERSYQKEDNFEIAFNGIKTLLINPRLRLEVFVWKNHLSSEIDEKLIDLLNSLNHKLEIVDLKATLDGDLMIDLVKAMKPGTLRNIGCGGKFESIQIDRLAQLEQWKKAKSVYFYEIIPDFSSRFHYFQHFEWVNLRIESVSMDDILFVKKLFTQNDKLEYFHIVVNDKPSESEIVEALGLYEYPIDEESEFTPRRFDIPGSNEYVNVNIFKKYGINFRRGNDESSESEEDSDDSED